MKRNRVKILDVPIDSFSKEEILEYLKEKINLKMPVNINTVNTEFIIQATNKPEVMEMLKNSSLNTADGVGILWAAKFLSLKIHSKIQLFFKYILSILSITFYPKYIRNPLKFRITGADFIWDLCRFAKDQNLSVFLLGGEPTVAEQAALKLQTEILGLKLAGTYGGSAKIEDEEKIVSIIKKTKADILFVAYGVPNEELWIYRNLKSTQVKVAIGVGGTFDFLSGRRKRAPKFLAKIGLEWFWRLIIEPKRLKRQMALPKFMSKIYRYKLNNLSK